MFIQIVWNDRERNPDAGHHSFDIPGGVSEGIIPAVATGKIHGQRAIQRHLLRVRFSVPGSDRGVQSGGPETAQRISAIDEKDKTICSQGIPAGYKRYAIQTGSGQHQRNPASELRGKQGNL